MLAVTGKTTTIVKEYMKLAKLDDLDVWPIGAEPSLAELACHLVVPDADQFILAAGLLHQKRLHQQTGAEIRASVALNFVNVVRICETALEKNEAARICVIGSESAFGWSWDDTYAGMKAALHRYVEKRSLRGLQQLVCVSPPIISDSGMTTRRKDYPAILKRRPSVTASAVAKLVYELLNGDIDLNNVVVRMTGKVQ